MYIIKTLIFLSIFFLNILLASTSITLTNEEKQFIKNTSIIKVGAEKDWAPFDFVENGVYKGFAKDYLDLISKKTSLKFSYDFDKWGNLLNKAETNQIDLLPLLAKSPDRENYLLYTDSYLSIRDYVFALDDTIINNVNDFKDKTIAIVKGYVQEKYIKKNYPQINILIVNSILESIDAIETKKADFIISNVAIMNYLTKKHNLSNLHAKFFLNYHGNVLYMATNKQSPILNSIITKALKSITDEEKNKISSKWIDTKTTESSSFTKEEQNYINKTRELTIANELAYKPYDYNENGMPKGYTIDYIKLLFSRIGINLVFKSDNWINLIDDFKDKKIDIMPIIAKNKKREEYINFTKPYINQDMVIITKKSNTSIINIDDLNGKTLAGVKGWSSIKFVKKNHPKINVIEYLNVNEFLNAVSNNYADAAILNKLSANYNIKSNYINKLHITGNANIKEFNSQLLMGVQKDNVILKNILEKGMLLITENELKALDNKWINSSKGNNFTKKELDFIKNTLVKVSATGDWAPFSFRHEGKAYGLGFDFWNLIKDKANIKSKHYFEDSFSLALESIKEKKNDILVTTSKTKDREEFALFSNEYFKAPIGIATLKNKNYIPNGSNLIGKKVAVGKNYSAYKLIKEVYPRIILIPVSGIDEALKLLSKDEVFAVIDIMPVLTYNIKSKAYNNIKITGVTGIDFSMRILIRKDYEILQSIINKVLKNITPKEKEIIFDKWLKIEYEEAFDYSLFWKVIIIFLIILIFVLYKNNQLVKYQRKLKITTKELESSIKNFETLIDLSFAGILIIRDKKIVYLNKELLNIFKYQKYNELVKKDISILFQEKQINKIIKETNKIDESFDINGFTKNEDAIPLLINIKEIIYDNLPSHIISVIDLTDIKNKEELIIQQSKMASLGEMIGNIAHQWRQPLSSITTTASGVKLQKEYGLLDDKNLYESMDSITNTTLFLSQTIDDFQNYIKKDKMKQKFNIKTNINTVLSIMKGSLNNHFIKIEKNIENIEIYSYENELNQALLNILTNSKDALKNIQEQDRVIYINVFKKENNVVIEIIDTAGGIANDVINKVFEPYFTTKHKSQGTGLGLYLTHKIINEILESKIEINNVSYKNYKKCTKVTITLPIN